MNSNPKIFSICFSLLVAALAVSLTGCVPRAKQAARLEVLVDSLGTVYAPDSRLAVWDLSVWPGRRSIRLEGEVDSREGFEAITGIVRNRFPGVEIRVILIPEEGTDRIVNGAVNNSVANFRAGPSNRDELVSQALLGTPVRILKEENDWYLVQMPNRLIGWTGNWEVVPLSVAALESYRQAMKVVYTGRTGSCFSAPDRSSPPVSDLVSGCILPVTDSMQAFYQVRYPDGRKGWIEKGSTLPLRTVLDHPADMQKLTGMARYFLGIPYLWGGTSPKGFDCSGLTTHAFMMQGILLPRDSDQQSRCGRVVGTEYSWEGLVPGDLLFFGRKAEGSQPEKVTHVAIYLGDSEFVHASGYRDRVSLNSMDSTRIDYIDEYPGIFLRAVRIPGEDHRGWERLSGNIFYAEITTHSE